MPDWQRERIVLFGSHIHIRGTYPRLRSSSFCDALLTTLTSLMPLCLARLMIWRPRNDPPAVCASHLPSEAASAASIKAYTVNVVTCMSIKIL